MDSQVSRSAWVGAGSALVLALLTTLAAGGGHPQDVPAQAPTALQAPTPTLDAVSLDPKPASNSNLSAATPVKAQTQATPIQR